jgi:hypothetical protein
LAFIKLITRFFLDGFNKTKKKKFNQNSGCSKLEPQNFFFFNKINFLFVMGLFDYIVIHNPLDESARVCMYERERMRAREIMPGKKVMLNI